MDEKRQKSAVERAADEKLVIYGGALGGMLAGQALDSPIQALVNDAKEKRLKKERPRNVLFMSDAAKTSDSIAAKSLRSKRRARYLPKLGLPGSKSAIVGGVIGSTITPIIVEQLQEIREGKELALELEKEACASYVTLPNIKRPNFL